MPEGWLQPAQHPRCDLLCCHRAGARLGVPMSDDQAPRRSGGGPIVQPVDDDDDDDDEEPDAVDDDFPAGVPARAYPGGPYPPGRDAGLPDMPEVCTAPPGQARCLK